PAGAWIGRAAEPLKGGLPAGAEHLADLRPGVPALAGPGHGHRQSLLRAAEDGLSQADGIQRADGAAGQQPLGELTASPRSAGWVANHVTASIRHVVNYC